MIGSFATAVVAEGEGYLSIIEFVIGFVAG